MLFKTVEKFFVTKSRTEKKVKLSAILSSVVLLYCIVELEKLACRKNVYNKEKLTWEHSVQLSK